MIDDHDIGLRGIGATLPECFVPLSELPLRRSLELSHDPTGLRTFARAVKE